MTFPHCFLDMHKAFCPCPGMCLTVIFHCIFKTLSSFHIVINQSISKNLMQLLKVKKKKKVEILIQSSNFTNVIIVRHSINFMNYHIRKVLTPPLTLTLHRFAPLRPPLHGISWKLDTSQGNCCCENVKTMICSTAVAE